MWQAYMQLPQATLVGCWAHVRRKFDEAVPQTASDKSLAKKGLNYCNRMFYLEQTWEALNKQERCRLRQEKLKHQETFENVLLDGHLELSNNKAERAVKSLIMGRRNWLFSQSFAGVKASGIILSLIETAKRNGLDPEKYLLEKLPNEKDLESNTLEAYLPWQKEVKILCK